MRYTVLEWPDSQNVMERDDAIFIEDDSNCTWAIPDECGDYVLYEWPESQDKDGFLLPNAAKLVYEPIKKEKIGCTANFSGRAD